MDLTQFEHDEVSVSMEVSDVSTSSRPLTQLPYQELYDHAYGLVTDLTAAFELLAENERSTIRDRLVRTLGLRPKTVPATAPKASNSAAVRQINHRHQAKPMSRCPHCRNLVRTDRLEQHIQDVHIDPGNATRRRVKQNKPKKVRMVL
jgi:hypothetical protein